MNLRIVEQAKEFIGQEGGAITVKIEKRLIPG
ncbi:hypothetical protein SPACI_031640 [Sporomusa acidovorans DSM 3132]|uniref:Uncharacterized protein n=1 Tax=Sporomusa acidovorans (strain ATCC 49682 / DSM 3132 / Mol) TaxID=1123286 RepID=A0ABZ3J4T2_SPOA4|nr:hypothetical protein SPACI_47840 [Sporomusa acidovorans DSM 3132]SDE15771.1 hypothetical protein SAMN04488499_100910 [Sporomusa acidovorans]